MGHKLKAHVPLVSSIFLLTKTECPDHTLDHRYHQELSVVALVSPDAEAAAASVVDTEAVVQEEQSIHLALEAVSAVSVAVAAS